MSDTHEQVLREFMVRGGTPDGMRSLLFDSPASQRRADRAVVPALVAAFEHGVAAATPHDPALRRQLIDDGFDVAVVDRALSTWSAALGAGPYVTPLVSSSVVRPHVDMRVVIGVGALVLVASLLIVATLRDGGDTSTAVGGAEPSATISATTTAATAAPSASAVIATAAPTTSAVTSTSSLSTSTTLAANLAPTAILATFSSKTRAERTRVCVLQRADDPDGDPLTISSVSDAVPVGQAQIGTGIDGEPQCGQSVYYEWPVGWTGEATIGWTVSDGRGGSANALLVVTVLPNAPEVSVSGPEMVTVSGGGCPYTFEVVVERASGWYWALDGEKVDISNDNEAQLPRIRFPSAGTFEIQVVATDDDGDSTTGSLSVSAAERSEC